MYCAHLWVMHEGFFPIAFLYSLFAVIGFSLAWVAYGRLSDQTNASPQYLRYKRSDAPRTIFSWPPGWPPDRQLQKDGTA
jgi:hypothetical protein